MSNRKPRAAKPPAPAPEVLGIPIIVVEDLPEGVVMLVNVDTGEVGIIVTDEESDEVEEVDVIVVDVGAVTRHGYATDGGTGTCELRVVAVDGEDYLESEVCSHGKQAVTSKHPRATR